MRVPGFPRVPHGAEERARSKDVADGDSYGAQVRVEREVAAAMVDDDVVAEAPPRHVSPRGRA